MAKTVNLANYTVKGITYYKQGVDAKGAPIEVAITTDVELFKMRRTSMTNSKFAYRILGTGSEEMNDKISDMAVDFCKMMIVDDKLRDDLVQDICACVDLYTREEVQGDLADFFGKWEMIKRIQAPEEQSPKN